MGLVGVWKWGLKIQMKEKVFFKKKFFPSPSQTAQAGVKLMPALCSWDSYKGRWWFDIPCPGEDKPKKQNVMKELFPTSHLPHSQLGINDSK